MPLFSDILQNTYTNIVQKIARTLFSFNIALEFL